MTLRPVEASRITVPPQDAWIPYELPFICQVPGCWHSADDPHHIVRRSDTGGPVDYVSIDGLVVANKMAICRTHHDEVTGGVGGHKAMIRFPGWEEIAHGLYSAWWLWYARLPSAAAAPRWVLCGPIDQPRR